MSEQVGRPGAITAARGHGGHVLALVSIATALWLAADVFAKVTRRATTWPAAALTMFAEPRQEATTLSLRGLTESGKVHTVVPEDFGFKVSNELHVFLARRVIESEGLAVRARVGGGANALLLARLYNERHKDDPLTRLDIDATVEKLPLDSNSRETTRRVLRVRL
jgi:hypothetical protein